jgi:hypothetical protein
LRPFIGKERIMAKTQIIAEPGVPQIVITREFAAPRELLFRAHTDPELLVQWLGPRRLTMTIDRLDARHGGTWRYIHREADGTEYAFHGVYHGTPSPDGIRPDLRVRGRARPRPAGDDHLRRTRRQDLGAPKRRLPVDGGL